MVIARCGVDGQRERGNIETILDLNPKSGFQDTHPHTHIYIKEKVEEYRD